MKRNFDFEAGRRLREEGDLAEALRCLRSAVDDEPENVETYVELAVTYLAAFDESGDPLCLDSARKVCLSGMRRDPSEIQRRRLLRLQDEVEERLLESQKAEADAMADVLDEAMHGTPEGDAAAGLSEGLDPDAAAVMLEVESLLDDEDLDRDRGH